VENVGTWCHGIAFWEDTSSSQIKLISLDSKSGTAVSVVLSGPNKGSREVLWTPDLNHPVLQPPEGVAQAYNNGAKVFSKGLAVQGGVAYFGVSYARAPNLRATVPETLLVAVELSTKKELWVRTVKSNGLINQIMTRSNLGDIQLPAEMSSVELTYHGGGDDGNGGTLIDFCEDLVGEDEMELCKFDTEGRHHCNNAKVMKACCLCKGGEWSKKPLLAGHLDREIMKMKSNDIVTATATFVHTHQCLDENGMTKRIPLEMKSKSQSSMVSDLDRDLNFIVKHLCNVNVKPLQDLILELGDEGFTHSAQIEKNNAVVTDRKKLLDKWKPGVQTALLIFSTKDVAEIYHFPWLNEWLPLIQELILQPLGIQVNQIVRMQLANMQQGSDIKFHTDKNRWVEIAHRVHVPIVTHPNIFFLAKTHHQRDAENTILRIKSNAGEVYEFNNAKGHAVRNDGDSRVHLIIDWADEAMYDEEGNGQAKFVTLRPKEVCSTPKGSMLLQCVDGANSWMKSAEDHMTSIEKQLETAIESMKEANNSVKEAESLKEACER